MTVPLPDGWRQHSYNDYTGKLVYLNGATELVVERDVTDDPPTFTVQVADEDSETFSDKEVAHRYVLGTMLQYSSDTEASAETA